MAGLDDQELAPSSERLIYLFHQSGDIFSMVYDIERESKVNVITEIFNLKLLVAAGPSINTF